MLDFTNGQKKFLTIKLIDGKIIMVRMPTKKIFESLNDLRSNLSALRISDAGQIQEIYELTGEILSNNMKNEKIDSEYLGKILDVEDISTIFTRYVGFVQGKVDDPNSKSPQSQAKDPEGNTTDAEQIGRG